MVFILTFNYSLTYGQFAENEIKLRTDNYLQINKILRIKLNSSFKRNNLKTDNPDQDTARTFGIYVPNVGFKLLETKDGDVNFSLFSYMRYINQKGLDSNYTDAFGVRKPVQRRQDVVLNKVNLTFKGWFMDQKFRYLFYVWTSNSNIGQNTQVVVAGKLEYSFNKYFKFGAGVNGLPGTRSTAGNFPFWLTVDNRLYADEFFRPGYTAGFWANGAITDKLNYFAMIGNNLSQFGIDAGQLDAGMNTFSGTIFWFPTTGEYGLVSDFGDFEDHQKPATRLAGYFTFSEEDRESQPTTDNFENVSIRLSDGNLLFKRNLFASGISIKKAIYKMTTVDAGVKYKGFALEGQYYWRWLSNFTGDSTEYLGFNLLTDNGFQAMLSYMVIQKRLQLFTTFSQVFGDYGNPYDARVGLNFFPFKNQTVRWNFEYIQSFKSPVGALSLPYNVGGTGGIFNTDFMINF